MDKTERLIHQMPDRYKRPSLLGATGWLILIFLFVQGVQASDITFQRLFSGVFNMGTFLSRAFPPDFSRIQFVLTAIFQTFQMALVGTIVGVILSLPISILAARNLTPSQPISKIMKAVVSLMRTIPDLVWALVFVISVGLGPLAGILTIIVDTIGFCARFFSERIEEMDEGPLNALESTGSSRFGVITGAVIPLCLPSFIATSLFSFEQAIRSAVVLGLVGAGGIGVELSTSITLRQFQEALMIILLIFVVVLVVEQISTRIRKKLI